VVLLAAGCSGDDDKTAARTTAAAWPGPPRPGPAGRLDIAGFNRFLVGRDGLARSPLQAGIQFTRLDREEASTTSAIASTGREGSDRAVVVLTASGLLDDSVRATRYTLVFERRRDRWRLRSARQAQRCWPGRGHQAFSPRACV
jgi:hypothetical protein